MILASWPLSVYHCGLYKLEKGHVTYLGRVGRGALGSELLTLPSSLNSGLQSFSSVE